MATSLDVTKILYYQVTMLTSDRILTLRWSIALVLGVQAGLLLMRTARGLHPAGLGILAGAELIGALLLLLARTTRPGAVLLFAALAVAALLHALEGAVPSAAYLVYAAALWVVAATPRREA
jgi:hypothetical protein